MADDVKAQPGKAAGVVADAQQGGLKKILKQHWLMAVVGLSLVLHGGGFAYFTIAGRAKAEPLPPEVTLGAFHFVANGDLGATIRSADFTLHIGLENPQDKLVRQQLVTAQARVRQSVEQLLRQAHPADFEDPTLSDLKRQLQTEVNQTLGVRAVAEAIITDFSVQRGPASASVAPAGNNSGTPSAPAAAPVPRTSSAEKTAQAVGPGG
jgi:flagellar basal body-associated protein FliL